MILIIGYGSFGRKVVNYAKILDKVVVIDKNASVFESLEKVDFNYIVGDASEKETLIKANIQDADTILVLTNEYEINKKIAELVSELNPKGYLIVRGIVKYPDLYSGIDVNKIIYPIECAAKEVIHEIEKSKLRRKLMDLKEIVMDVKVRHNNTTSENSKLLENNENSNRNVPFLIVMHNNPDPDSIASAMALKRIMGKWGVDADITYGGKIGFDENKAMVNLLGVKLTHIDNVNLENYEGIAVVDASSSKVLPIDTKTHKIDIIIDHHDNGDLTADYMDIQPDIGAASTILTGYLIHLNMTPKQDLATALYYAICTDTNYFKRKTSKKDFEAAGYLQDLMDPKTLEMIENPEMDTETMEILATAIINRKIIRSSIALSYVGMIKNRDALPKAADFLLKMEGITTTYVFGISENKIHISARTKDLRVDVGDIMKRAFGGGGHQNSAAASIDLGIFESVSDKDSLRTLVEEAIQTKILEVMGIGESGEKPN
ncbi:DHH family phosphoesterase [Methanothermococcus sp.]|uniref:DHH family phosphoesterase n=1 Tax=Methanothermococcus sp. TaxID=2614238 RepID=UPI0025F7BA52|nr:DHH family phosphoesterase [Methanothermococcus sp.]